MKNMLMLDMAGFETIFWIVGGVAALGFVFVLVFMFNPRLRSKIMGGHIKSMKMTMDDNKDDLQSIATTGAEVSAPGIKIMSSAVGEGLGIKNNNDTSARLEEIETLLRERKITQSEYDAMRKKILGL